MNTLSVSNNRDFLIRLIIFVIWPFAGFITAIASFQSKGSKFLITAFGFIWGYGLIITNPEADSYRYASHFIEASYLNFSQFIFFIQNLYGDSPYNDIYGVSSYFFVSRLTSNPHFLFAFWGAVFFFLFASIVSLLLNYIHKYNYKVYGSALIPFIAFILLMPVNSINGARMWTALLFYMYFILRGILDKNLKYIVLSSFSILIHFSFIFPVILAFSFWLFKDRGIFFYVLFGVSLFANLFIGSVIESYSDVFSDGIEGKIQNYNDEDYIARTAELTLQQNWYAILKGEVLKYYLYGIMIVVLIYKQRFGLPRLLKYLFYFSITLLSLYNFTSMSVGGGRYLIIFAFFSLIFYTILITFRKDSSLLTNYAWIGLLPLGFWIIITQVNALRSFDFNIIFGNVFIYTNF